MAQTRDPLQVAQELQARQPETPAEVEEQLNLVEELIAAITPRDDYDQAILAALNAVKESLDVESGEAVDTSNLSIGRMGRAVYDIPNGQTGQARFEIGGGVFLATVNATQDIAQTQPVAVVGPNNQVEPVPETDLDPAGSGGGGVLTRVHPDTLINVINESWTSAAPTPDPQTSLMSFSGNLTAGESEVICEAQSDWRELELEVREVGTTSHRADLDGDGTDESIVRYHYEYQKDVEGAWYPVPGVTSVQALGDMVNTAPLLSDGAIGPVYGFRIRFENRSDETTNQASVNPEEMGARFIGRVLV